eukprot:4871583-Amphidinium_carterae.1
MVAFCKGSLSLLISTGAIPSSLTPQVVILNDNLLGGPIPQRLIAGSEQAQKVVSAKALECRTCQQGQHAACYVRGPQERVEHLGPGKSYDGTLIGMLSTGGVVDSKLAPMLGLVGVR